MEWSITVFSIKCITDSSIFDRLLVSQTQFNQALRFAIHICTWQIKVLLNKDDFDQKDNPWIQTYLTLGGGGVLSNSNLELTYSVNIFSVKLRIFEVFTKQVIKSVTWAHFFSPNFDLKGNKMPKFGI